MTMLDLVDLLNRYCDAYYNENRSVVSDKEYDKLFDELRKMEEETHIVYPHSPTQRVGYEVKSKLNKVKHNHPLLSLNKTTDFEEFRNYFGNKNAVMMGKMDGLTASLTYRNGELVLAESRGNGEVGEDITHNARVFCNLPIKIPFKGELIIDGECIISDKDFERINREENAEYKNPRNLVSGTVRQLDNTIVKRRNVKFIAWRLHSAKDYYGDEIDATKNHYESLLALEDFGFEIVPWAVLCDLNINEWNGARDYIESTCRELGYRIDGLVATFEDVAYGNSLGSTGHHPKHSLAFKFYQERNKTILRDIIWNTSRTGLCNPVAIFDPVDIDDTTVSRASLSNVSIIKELELGIGDEIEVIKANQIIPQVVTNLTKSNTYEIPNICPACGGELVIQDSTGREMLYCRNDRCIAIRHDMISNFASREGMNIVGLSEERLMTLMMNSYITDFASVYELYRYESEIIKLPGFGKSIVKKLLKAIEDSKDVKLENLLVAVGLPNVGKSAAKSLAREVFKNYEDRPWSGFIRMCCRGCNWSKLDGFGETISLGINRYVQAYRDDLAAIGDYVNIQLGEARNVSNKLRGKTFCITGTLVAYKNRDALVSDIEANGGKLVGSVTKKTDYLITNDRHSGSTKCEKAKSLGINIITETQFKKMIT